jgi:hypothetical protein
MTFRVGQKVVCIDARGAKCLTEGNAYRILGTDGTFFEVTCCHLHTLSEHAWFPFRFRGTVERKTDISIFKRMLVPREKSRETI